MSVRPNQNLYPDGGYIFVEGDGTKFRGEGWRDLILKVKAYRSRNKKPPGDPEDEVFSQYCARMPSHCKDARNAVPIQAAGSSLNKRVLQHVAYLIEWKRKAPLPRVDDSEAAARAAVCAHCPRQKTLVQSCQPCLATVKHGRKVIFDGQPSQHQGLMACDALGEDLPITVHIEQPPVPESAVPANCWRKLRR